MTNTDPLKKSREAYRDLIEQISLQDSPVGIDAQYTHAIIIEYLRQIDVRLRRLEKKLGDQD